MRDIARAAGASIATVGLCAQPERSDAEKQPQRHHRLRIPEDLSIADYDDVLSQSLSPAIDSVGLVMDGIGETVMALLLERRENPYRPTEQRYIYTRYAGRNTVVPPSQP